MKPFLAKIVTLVCLVLGALVQAIPSTTELLRTTDVSVLKEVVMDPEAGRSEVYTAMARLESISGQQPQACLALAEIYQNNLHMRNNLRIMSDSERTDIILTYYMRASRASVEANCRLAKMLTKCGQDKAAWLFLLRAASLGSKEALQRLMSISSTIDEENLRKYVQSICGGQSSSLAPELKQGFQADITDTYSRMDHAALKAYSLSGLSQLYSELCSKVQKRVESYEYAEAQKPKPPSEEFLFARSVLTKMLILGLVGFVYTAIKGVYLYNGKGDVCLTSLLAVLFVLAAGYKSNDFSMPIWLRVVLLILIIGAMVPLSLKANPGMVWSLFLVIPAKMLLSALTIFCAFGAVAYASSASNRDRTRRQRRDDLGKAIIYGALTFLLYKFVKHTTKPNE